MYQKSAAKKNMSNYYWYEKKGEGTIFLFKILMHSLMAIHYIVEKQILSPFLQALSSDEIL